MKDKREELRQAFSSFGLTPLIHRSKEAVVDVLHWLEQRRSVHKALVYGKLDIAVYDRDPRRGDDGKVILAADGATDWAHAQLVRMVPGSLNILTDNGLIVMAHILGKDAARVATYDIVKTAIGTGSTAETVADTALVTEVFRDVFDDVVYPAGGAVRYDMVVETTEPAAQPVTLREAGLFANGGTLVARKTYGAITKDTTFAFDYRWTLSLARA